MIKKLLLSYTALAILELAVGLAPNAFYALYFLLGILIGIIARYLWVRVISFFVCKTLNVVL